MNHRHITIGICVILFVPSCLASALVAKGVGADLHCQGSLTIAYEDSDGNIDTLQLVSHGSKDLKRRHPVMKKNTISYVEVSGDCCWGLYPSILFRGEGQIAFPGEGILYADFQPFSIRRMECPY